jgi:hypothetical protein
VKLVVPYIGELLDLDVRMVRLAEFLGIPCETIALAGVSEHAEFLAMSVPEECSCLVVTSQVIKNWVGSERIPAELVDFLLSRFTHLVVHGLRANPFDSELVAALSNGRLKSVEKVEPENSVYTIETGSKDVCEGFAGLTFGPVSSANDHVLSVGSSDPAVRQLISIGCLPFMAAVKTEGAEILFVGSEDVADLNAEVGNAPLASYFSRLVPQAMALRFVAGDECWRPSKGYASIIIDDPLLRKNYGYLNFDSLLLLAEQHNFHATIAFIPHNFRRNSSRITSMFQENSARLSICFHGNDHVDAEFASTNVDLLNSLALVAEDRMNRHFLATGLACDKVMVFPQGNFSMEAMTVLKSRDFHAAVNTVPHPTGHPVQLTIGELAQPAVTRYGGFPLFLRRPARDTQSHDIAFNLFFGRPVLIVEHHEIFEHPERLVEIAARINSVAPEIRWSGLASAVGHATLARRASDGTYHVRAYSGATQVSNDSVSVRRYSIEWGGECDVSSIEQVLMDGTPCRDFEIDDAGLRLTVELQPGSSCAFALVHRNDLVYVRSLGLRWKVRAFSRRRLSEFRDNYLSKNQGILTAAKAFQRRFLRI